MVDPQKLENIEPDTKSEEQIITYLEEDAGKIRAHVAGQLLPGQEIIYALLLRVAGLNTTAENVHDGWAAWRLLCRPNDTHKDLIPYDDLNPATQILDEPYAQLSERWQLTKLRACLIPIRVACWSVWKSYLKSWS